VGFAPPETAFEDEIGGNDGRVPGCFFSSSGIKTVSLMYPRHRGFMPLFERTDNMHKQFGIETESVEKCNRPIG